MSGPTLRARYAAAGKRDAETNLWGGRYYVFSTEHPRGLGARLAGAFMFFRTKSPLYLYVLSVDNVLLENVRLPRRDNTGAIAVAYPWLVGFYLVVGDVHVVKTTRNTSLARKPVPYAVPVETRNGLGVGSLEINIKIVFGNDLGFFKQPGGGISIFFQQ